MTSLTSLISALEATWPPAGSRDVAGCRVRTAPGAGSRVNSIRPLRYDLDDAAIATAEQEAIALAGAPLWALPDGDGAPVEAEALANRLVERGYERFDESLLLCAPTGSVLEAAKARADARKGDAEELGKLTIRCPLAAVDRIWSAGGVGAERQAVMQRVKGPSEVYGGRHGHRLTGMCFVAVDEETKIAFVHALEVEKPVRSKGVGPTLMATAARFAAKHGAGTLAVAVRSSNKSGLALFKAIGMERQGGYVYWRKSE